MPSADLDRAVETAVQARVINKGSCIAAKTVIVHQKIAEQFEKKFVARMSSSRSAIPWSQILTWPLLPQSSARLETGARNGPRWRARPAGGSA